MLIILYCFLFIILALVLMLVLPVKFYFEAEGDSGDGFEAKGRVMFYGGFAGGGGRFMTPGKIFLEIYVLSLRLFSFEITGLIQRARSREKKPVEKKKEKKEKPELPLKERITGGLRKAKMGVSIVRKVVRFDYCRGNVTLGLANPAKTGQVAGIIYALNGIFPGKFRILPSWDFSRKVFKGNISLKITVLNYIIWKLFFIHAGHAVSGKLRKTAAPGIITQEV